MNESKNDEYAELRHRIIEVTTQEKPEGETHWSTRTLAEKLGTSPCLCHEFGVTIVSRNMVFLAGFEYIWLNPGFATKNGAILSRPENVGNSAYLHRYHLSGEEGLSRLALRPTFGGLGLYKAGTEDTLLLCQSVEFRVTKARCGYEFCAEVIELPPPMDVMATGSAVRL